MQHKDLIIIFLLTIVVFFSFIGILKSEKIYLKILFYLIFVTLSSLNLYHISANYKLIYEYNMFNSKNNNSLIDSAEFKIIKNAVEQQEEDNKKSLREHVFSEKKYVEKITSSALSYLKTLENGKFNNVLKHHYKDYMYLKLYKEIKNIIIEKENIKDGKVNKKVIENYILNNFNKINKDNDFDIVAGIFIENNSFYKEEINKKDYYKNFKLKIKQEKEKVTEDYALRLIFMVYFVFPLIVNVLFILYLFNNSKLREFLITKFNTDEKDLNNILIGLILIIACLYFWLKGNLNIDNKYFDIYDVLKIIVDYKNNEIFSIILIIVIYVFFAFNNKKEIINKIFYGSNSHLNRIKVGENDAWIIGIEKKEYKYIDNLNNVGYIAESQMKNYPIITDIGLFKIKMGYSYSYGNYKNPILFIKNKKYHSKKFIDFTMKNSNLFVNFRKNNKMLFINKYRYKKDIDYEKELIKLIKKYNNNDSLKEVKPIGKKKSI
jgi:hypothetical protein